MSGEHLAKVMTRLATEQFAPPDTPLMRYLSKTQEERPEPKEWR